MSSQKSLTALQPFLLLSKSATGRAAADLIHQATQSPDVYVFSELLSCPTIAALGSTPDGSPYYNFLKIFAYGSYSDYQANAGNLPPLNDAQLKKLKQLSLITLASRGPQNLSYESLLASLDLPNIRALEDLVISAIYAELVEAKLDTKSRLVEVTSTAGRDVAPSEVSEMVSTLNAWASQCDAVLADIDAQMASIKKEAIAKKQQSDDYQKLVAKKRDEVKEEGTGGKGGKGKRVISEGAEDGRGLDDDEMDLDDGPFGGGGAAWEGANTSRRRTKGRFGNLMAGNKRR